MSEWQDISSAPTGVLVRTKIDDAEFGPRNDTTLIKDGRLWWTPDMAMYVYYAPTHWMPLINSRQPEKEKES